MPTAPADEAEVWRTITDELATPSRAVSRIRSTSTTGSACNASSTPSPDPPQRARPSSSDQKGRRGRSAHHPDPRHRRGARTATSRSTSPWRRSTPTACTRPSRQGIEENLGDGCVVRTATLDDPEHGLTEEVLAQHRRAHLVGARGARRGRRRGRRARAPARARPGMGLVVLHSGHWSKIFTKLMGTTCTLRWRAEHDRELVWTVDPTHPIAQGVPHPLDHRRGGDVRRVLRHPRAGRAGLHQLLQRRRSLPLRLHVPPRPRQDLLLPARRPGLPHVPPQGRPPGHRERRRVGRSPTGRSGASRRCCATRPATSSTAELQGPDA